MKINYIYEAIHGQIFVSPWRDRAEYKKEKHTVKHMCCHVQR